MAKEIAGFIKLQIKGGAANPAPPVGPALGSKGVNIMEFCKQFNARTQDKAGKVLPVIITVYADKSFDFIVKTPPVAIQLLGDGCHRVTVRLVAPALHLGCLEQLDSYRRSRHAEVKRLVCINGNNYR